MKRSSGVLMHISCLFGDYSIGSIGSSAKAWIDFLADCGFSYWQTLPLCLPDEYHSPYRSFGAFSLNPYLIDLPTLREKGWITGDELQSARQTTPYRCEFDRLSKERMALLQKAAERASVQDEIDSFLHAHPESAAFCRFMAARAQNGNRPFYEWETDTCDETAYRVWTFTQYEAYTEWMAMKGYANRQGIRLIGDVPMYVSDDSADVMTHPDEFELDENRRPSSVAGVPPDYFCRDGQRWGNPLYRYDVMKENNYSFWRRRIGFMAELFDGIRLDHFRGFASYFSIPANEETAKHGSWKKGPGIDLVSALRDACPNRLLIAEDLGDITPDVTDLIEKSGLPGMRVFQFGFLGDENSPHLPHNYPLNSVCYSGTHDNNTLLGYVWDLDDETRRLMFRYCGYTGESFDGGYDAILRTLFASHGGLLILPVQDLLLYGNDTRMNQPGSVDGNWEFRVTEEQFQSIDRLKFREWNRRYGRLPR